MFKHNSIKTPSTAWLFASALAGFAALSFSPNSLWASACGPNRIADGAGFCEPAAHVGDTVHLVVDMSVPNTVCLMQGGTNWLVTPDNAPHAVVLPFDKLAANSANPAVTCATTPSGWSLEVPACTGAPLDLPPPPDLGSGVVCSNGGLGTSTCQGGARLFFTYVVKPTDVVPAFTQDKLTFITPFRNVPAFGTTQTVGGTGVPIASSAQAGIYIGAVCDAGAWDCASGNAPVGQAVGANITFLPIVTNHITVVKNCPPPNCPPNSVGTGTTYGQNINFTGTVCNDGTVAVTITVTNFEAGAGPMVITNFNPTTHNGVTFAGSLNPGDCIDFSGTEAPLPPCGPVTNTVIASATDFANGSAFTTYATNGAVCPVCTTPCIQVTKNCGPTSTNLAAGAYTVSGSVTNCGNVPLTNVFVYDTVTNANGFVSTFTVSLTNSLLPGASISIPPIAITFTNCGPSSDFFTVVGSNPCDGAISNRSLTCTTLVTYTPCVQVTKTCGPAFIDVATGTYTVGGSVTNCSSEPLTGVVIFDVVTNDSVCAFTNGPFLIGTVPAFTQVPIPAITVSVTNCGIICGTNVDYFIVGALGPCNSTVTNTSATCKTVVTNTACISVVKHCPIPTNIDLSVGSYQVVGGVTNCGTEPLTGVTLIDTVTNDGIGTIRITNNIGTLGAGAGVAITNTITVTNCGLMTDVMTVNGQGPCGPASNNSLPCPLLVTYTPCINVTKTCGPAFIDVATGTYTVGGSVSNCSSEPLTGVVIFDVVTNDSVCAFTNGPFLIGTVPAFTQVPIPAITVSVTNCGIICGTNADYFIVGALGKCNTTVTNVSNVCKTVVGNTPCISVIKRCGPSNIDLSVGSYQVIGDVTNCGLATLTGVTLIDTLTNDGIGTITITNLIGTLAPGAGVAITNTITVTNCGLMTDVMTASGLGPCGPTVANSLPCPTLVTYTPCIQVTKICGPASIDIATGTYTVGGSVSNCSSEPLTGVVIFDVVTNDSVCAFTNGPFLIGTVPAFTQVPIPAITVSVTNCGNLCGTNSDYFIVGARGACNTTVTNISNVCKTVVTYTPCIQVTKTCGPAFIDVATGIYTVGGSVTNCSSEPLTGVVVFDVVTNDSLCAFTNGPFVIGTVAPFSSTAIPAITVSVTNCGNICGTNIDYFIVGAHGPCNSTVTNTSNPCKTVVTNTPCIGVMKVCGPTYVDLATGSYTISGFVTNCGTMPLTGVVVADTIADVTSGWVTTNRITIGTVPANSVVPISPQTITVTNCGPYTDFLSVTGTPPCGPAVTAQSLLCTTTVTNTPCVGINLTSGPPVIGLVSSNFTIGGSITNCGTMPLTGVQVCSYVTNVNTGVVMSNCFNLPNVPPHVGVTVPPTTVTITNCGPFNYFLTVIGFTCSSVSNGTPVGLTLVTNTPCLSITRTCGPALMTNCGTAPLSYTVTATVSNCSLQPMFGVYITNTVVNSSGTSITAYPVGTLGVHGTYTLPLITNTALCGLNTDQFTASGLDICSNAANAMATICSTTVTCPPPVICVSKLITCGPPAGITGCNSSLTYSNQAFGVAGTNEPAFCYQIIVSNCACVTLTNIQVSDPVLLAAGVPLNFPNPFTLAGFHAVTNYYGLPWPVGTHQNTVTASGQSALTGQTVTAATNAEAVVVPASVSCELLLSSDFNLNTNGTPDKNGCTVTLPQGSVNAPLQVSIVLHNTGQADLHVNLIDGTLLTNLVPCNDTNPVAIPTNVFVAAGQSVTITNFGCVLFTCPTNTWTVKVQGTVVASASYPCIYDTTGKVITTAVSECEACADCAVAVLCRVTGGGRMDPGICDTNCPGARIGNGCTASGPLCTALYPPTSGPTTGTQLQLTYITHGGQLGAPFSMKDCGEHLNNPCIRGEWEHVRHYQGKGNPRDVVTASHNVNPGSQLHPYDTLMCACLGCCESTDDQPNGKFLGVAKRFTLCNPDDHRVCGPMPSPAPDNAIIFTGIGRVTPTTDSGTSQKDEVYIIFRVYVEDRSEPGGTHPKGGTPPADVYCFQAWYARDVSGNLIYTSKHTDITTIETAFRGCLGADSCNFIESISTPAQISPTGIVLGGVPPGTLPNCTVCGRPADISDTGPSTHGNLQIHPATGATCP